MRLYDRLFKDENPGAAAEENLAEALNPDSLKINTEARLEPALGQLAAGSIVQFERVGYFCADSKEHQPEHSVFNCAVGLRDSWARVQRNQTDSSDR